MMRKGQPCEYDRAGCGRVRRARARKRGRKGKASGKERRGWGRGDRNQAARGGKKIRGRR